MTLSRPDLAPADREGLDRAAVYRPARVLRVSAPVAPLRREPRAGAEQIDQLLFGERFSVLRSEDGFAWGQAPRGGYVGWAAEDDLAADLIEPTHRVNVIRTIALAAPAVRAPATAAVSLNALARVEESEGDFSRVAGLGWLPTRHLASVGLGFRPVVETARRFLGVPYSWGGKDGFGLDCSGLVQQAFWAAGLGCPRDADQQAALGRAVAREDLAAGDLVCWRGHIGLMADAANLIHANAHHMAVAIEPLDEAISRIEPSAGLPNAFRRVDETQRAKT